MEDAIARGADYVGVGPVFQTGTKADAGEPVGLELVEYVAKIPIVQAFFKSDSGITVPAPSVPVDAEEVCVKELFNGRLWYLGFRKPKAKINPASAC